MINKKLDITNANKTAAFLKASDWLKESHDLAIKDQQERSEMAEGRISRLRNGTAHVSKSDLTKMEKAFPGFQAKYFEYLESEAGGGQDITAELSKKITVLMEEFSEYKTMMDTIKAQNEELLKRSKE